MNIERLFSVKNEEYKKEKKRLEDLSLEFFGKKIYILLTAAFISHYIILESFLIWVLKLIIKNEEVELLKEIAKDPNFNNTNIGVGSGLFFVIICIIGFGIWLIAGLYFWFSNNYGWGGWGKGLTASCKNSYSEYKEKKRLLNNKKEREEFFKFYKLYTEDEDFRNQYNIRFSKSSEKDDFLKRINE